MNRDSFDLLIIGAGINGAGIARDAAGRGIQTALVEAGDIGGATSSASTKLIHGGLRYLEFYAFGLVRKALAEREVLLRIAPHLAQAMPFVLPLSKETRPAWMIRAGLFLYDNLARRKEVPGASPVDLRSDHAGLPLDARYTRAFRYWDGWVDDSRLVIANAVDAARRGAEVIPRCGVSAATQDAEGWTAVLENGRTIRARQLVNCTGPWAEQVARGVLGLADAPRLNLVQGAHIVVRRVGRQPDAYMLQQPDGRIIFMIPYQGDFTLIGTTETPVAAPEEAGVTGAEIDYLLAAANRYLGKPLGRADIVASFAGVRPLVREEGKAARETTREWRLFAHADAAALTVIGGKLTTYRVLAEAVLAELYPETRPWTATEPLPGGDVPRAPGQSAQAAFAIWLRRLIHEWPNHDPQIVTRLARLYGTQAERMLEGGLGANLGGLFTAELDYLAREEWARSAEDVLWRRTKIGLGAPLALEGAVTHWFEREFTAS